MAREPGRILLAVDGEPHTDAAVGWALDLAMGLGLRLHAVHVRDPYLKQFYNDIYAQGREEYLEHVESCLAEKARATAASFEVAVQERLGEIDKTPVQRWTLEILDGDPADQVMALMEEGSFSLVVLGRRRRTRLKALRSRDLAERLSGADCQVPMLVVPEDDSGGG